MFHWSLKSATQQYFDKMLPRNKVSKSHLHCVCTSAVTSTLHSMFSSQVVSSVSCFLTINCWSSSHQLRGSHSVKIGHSLVIPLSQSYLLTICWGFFEYPIISFAHIQWRNFFKGPNSNISTFILLFYFHWGKEHAFLSLGAPLGPRVSFIFSLQFDAYVLSHRIHTYRNNSVQYWSNCNWTDRVIKHGSTCWQAPK